MRELLLFIGLLSGPMVGIIMLGTSLLSLLSLLPLPLASCVLHLCFTVHGADIRYGMGVVYAKTGKLRHAEHHYRRAADINPSNAVLLSSIGSVSQAPFYCGLSY